MFPNLSLSRGVERLYNMPLDPQGAKHDHRTSEAARLLCLSVTGVVIKDESIDSMVLNLARVAEEYGLDPEGVQRVLFAHEPGLAMEPGALHEQW